MMRNTHSPPLPRYGQALVTPQSIDDPENDPERGARITKRMHELGLQHQQLAAKVPASKEALRLWKGGSPISPGYLHALARALETTTEYIETGATGPAAPAAPADDVRSAVARLERALADHDQLALDHYRALNARVSALDAQLAALEAATGDVLAVLMTLRQELADATKPVAGERRQSDGPSTSQPADG